jgi:hypothetical protein
VRRCPGFAGVGASAAFSVALGAALAAGNLWVLAKVVSALLPEGAEGESPDAVQDKAPKPYGRAAWALVAALKMVALLSVVWLLMRHGLAAPLPLLIGLLSLPFGIAIGSLVSDRDAARQER